MEKLSILFFFHPHSDSSLFFFWTMLREQLFLKVIDSLLLTTVGF